MKKLTVGMLLLLLSGYISAQSTTIQTGAPFLKISPDARAGGMGDQGVATSPDAFSQYWNPAKYAFSKEYSGLAVSYTPYMNKLTNDVFLLNASYFTFLGEEERSTLSASIYYFNIGEIELNSLNGTTGAIQDQGLAKPNEFSLDVAYGLRLSDSYGMAVAARYIRSDLFNGVSEADTKAANTFAVDVAGYYEGQVHDLSNIEGKLRAGFNVKNIGPKLDYSNSEDNKSYLPTNLGIGVGYDFIFDEYNKLAVSVELNKLLVPTPEVIEYEDGTKGLEVPNKSVIGGMFSSFGDAPGGFSEEMKELMYSLGVEYSYSDAMFLRAGYFHENKDKGNRQHLTLGLGFKYNSFGLDASYLIPTSKLNNALENTLRFGLTWNFGGETSNAEY